MPKPARPRSPTSTKSRPHKTRVVRKPARPVFVPDHPERLGWYALTTSPQSEAIVVRLLQERGFNAINPVEEVEVRRSRRERHKRVVRKRSILTSMVLLASAGAVPWLTVLSVSRVTGVIGFGGQPASIPPSAALHLIRLSGLKARTRHPIPLVGDQAQIVAGPFEGFEGKVISINEGRAKLLLGLSGAFGEGCRPVDVPEETLEKLAG